MRLAMTKPEVYLCNFVGNLPNITRAIKSRRIRWAVYVVRREKGEVHRETWWGDLMKGDHIEDLGVDGNKILKLIFKKSDGDTD
jgi:hypothetical protein